MRLPFTISIILFLSSCGPEVFYEKTVEIEDLGWAFTDAISFTPEIDDTERLNNIHLTVKHSPDYSYQNIYFKIKTSFPDSTVKEERLSVDLANGKGEWFGKCNKNSCALKIYLLENFKFPETGEYAFIISQDTRNDMLEGIQSLKFELVASEN